MLLILVHFGCGPERTASTHVAAPVRLLVLGLDGVDPEVVELLAAEGKLPHFAALKRDGAFGRLFVEPPLLSPVVWTTLATGKRATEHGIGHFTTTTEDGREIPMTSRQRRVKALWNIFSERERQVAVVGWWATWPAEEVRGTVVSDHTCYHFLNRNATAAADSRPGLVSPAARLDAVLAQVRRPESIGAAELAPYAQVEPSELERPFDWNDELWHLRWALASAFTYRDLGLTLWRDEKPDLLLSYIEATDSTAHLFGHLFRQQGLAGELARQQQRFGGTVEAVYRLADEMVGQYRAAMDESTVLVVVSDHGFTLGELPDDPSVIRDMRRVSEQYHEEHGILYLVGRGIRPGVSLAAPAALDLAPTLLKLAGLPVPEDMPGRPLDEIWSAPPATVRLSTYESSEAPATAAVAAESSLDPAVLAQLKALGYLGGAASTGSDRNIAFLALKDHRFAEAELGFRLLVEREPGDAGLLTGWASALAGLGRTGEALAAFDRALAADPLFVPAYHNRGLFHQQQGRRAEAVADYRRALRYAASYQPSREALERLGEPESDRVATTAEERRAAELVQATVLARQRGDYGEARRLLVEAAALAPGAAAVYQELANVAYLMGDTAAAVRALEEALKIEPDNALFASNLEKLRKRARAGG